jgi:hypothetical protein
MMKRSSEEQAILLMKLLIHWLEFWIEDEKEKPKNRAGWGSEFGITQIDGLQQCLERVRLKLEKSKN